MGGQKKSTSDDPLGIGVDQDTGKPMFKLSWEKYPENAEWSVYIYQLIRDQYYDVFNSATDWNRFHPDYEKLTKPQKLTLWSEFFSATSKFESAWNPKSAAVDVGKPDQKNTWSVGLMQVSVVDQEWAGGNLKYTYDALLTAKPNLHLATQLMSRQISKTGRVILPNDSKFRYWAVLLEGNKYSKIESITAMTKALKFTTSPQEDKKPIPALTSSAGPKWFQFAKKYSGKKETDPAFNKEMSAKWSLFGMNLGTIKESWAAWCGLAVAVSLAGVGLKIQKDGALARNWDKYGQKIEWKVNGFPKGAIIRINHAANCQSESSNHVTMANGDCAAKDLVKSGATFDGYGGNQDNTWKVSTYPVAHICSVRWPSEEKLPGKVEKSVGCTSGSNGTESTR